MSDSPVVSIVIVTYTRLDLLEACLKSLGPARAALGEPTELIVVANGSPESPARLVAEADPQSRLIVIAENLGFSGAVCQGIDAARGEWIALLNDDTTADPAALAEMLAAGRRDARIGSVASQLRFASDPGTINSAGIVIDTLGVTSDRLVGMPTTASEIWETEVFGTAGTAALYRREMLDQIGGFDPTFFAHLEDADVAWRARMAGWTCVYAPQAIVYHHHAATLRHFSPEKYFVGGRNRVRLLAKNADSSMLRHQWARILAYELAYVAYVAVRERSLAPLRGRVAGIREWRTYRSAGRSTRGTAELEPAAGFRGALSRRSTWLRSTDRSR